MDAPVDSKPRHATAGGIRSAGTAWQADAFRTVENAVYAALGLLLCVTALLALGSALMELWEAMRVWHTGTAILAVIDRLLLVFMLIEILHTVRTSMQSHTLACEPFLIVALIASVRRVLVITLQSAEVARDAAWTPEQETVFRATMIELVVLGALILVMVASIRLLRRSPPPGGAADGAAG
jgi:uncharacterized membrane protein (DUF373 family)